MRFHVLLLACLCFAVLAVAKRGKKRGLKHHAGHQAILACEGTHIACIGISKDPNRLQTCQAGLQMCKARVKEILSKLGMVKLGGHKRASKRGGSKRRSNPKHHFCQCFKKLIGCIKRQHSKGSTNSDGQKMTVHEEIFSNAQFAVSDVASGTKKNHTNNKCVRHFRCCLHKRCGSKRGGKGRGGKPRRKNRGAEKMASRAKKAGRGGRRDGKKDSPFGTCILAAKRCKAGAGRNKKKLKACAKAFVKCMLGKCKRGGHGRN